jgi:hypothetical protein
VIEETSMGEAGLSAAEVGKEIGEHRHHNVDHDEGVRAIAIAEAVLLAVVAVMAAFSGYASAKWSTESRVILAEASAARVEASTARLDADSQRNFDEETFGLWFSAYSVGNEEALQVAESMFSPELAVAFDAWLAADPANNADIPAGPTAMPEYDEPEIAEADELEATADELAADGAEAGETADEYIRTTLYLASVLFLVGISGHFRVRAARVGLVAVGVALTIFSAIQVVGLPNPPT